MKKAVEKKFLECFDTTMNCSINNFRRNKTIVPRYHIFTDTILITIGIETIEQPPVICDGKMIIATLQKIIDCTPNVFGVIGVRICKFFANTNSHIFVQLKHKEMNVEDLPDAQLGLVVWSECQTSSLNATIAIPIIEKNDEIILGDASIYQDVYVPEIEIYKGANK